MRFHEIQLLRRAAAAILPVLGLVTTLACGGIAVVDGAGGSSASNDTNTSSGGTGGATPDGLCQQTCSLIDNCLQGTQSCEQRCLDAGQGCTDAQAAWLQCLLANADTCAKVPACTPQLEAYLQCTGVLPGGPFDCSVSTNSCQCSYGGSDGAQYETFCNDPTADCGCYVDGTKLGTCPDPDALSCQPWPGCCSSILFVVGP